MATSEEIEAAARALWELECKRVCRVPGDCTCRASATAALAAAEKVRELRRERRETYRRLVDAVNKATERYMDNAAFRSGFIAGRDAACHLIATEYFGSYGAMLAAIRALEPPK